MSGDLSLIGEKPKVGKTAVVAPGSNCDCFSKRDAEMGEKAGVRISRQCIQFDFAGANIVTRYVLPLESNVGQRVKKGQPSSIYMSFCPFCGQKLIISKADGEEVAA